MKEKKSKFEEDLIAKVNTLEQSNRLLEDEVKRLRKKIVGLENIIDDKNKIITHLKSRGFFERVFNL